MEHDKSLTVRELAEFIYRIDHSATTASSERTAIAILEHFQLIPLDNKKGTARRPRNQ